MCGPARFVHQPKRQRELPEHTPGDLRVRRFGERNIDHGAMGRIAPSLHRDERHIGTAQRLGERILDLALPQLAA